MSQTLDETQTAAPPRIILVGGPAIVARITGKRDRKALRWLYGQLDKLPVWRLENGGILYAYADELDAHFEKKAAEARAARVAAAQERAARKDELAQKAASTVNPKNRRLSTPRPKKARPRAAGRMA